MSNKELFECLKRLSKTNNLRDGIDIRKEEANIIVKEIERLNNIIKEVKELLKNDYFEDGSFTSQEKVFELLDKGE